MGMAQLVVTAVLVEGRSKAAVAREYGVSRRWVITLVQRFLAEGEAGLVPRSRRPRHSPGRTAQQVEEEIVALRNQLDRDGHEAGAATIAAHLEHRHGPDSVDPVPATSTIWRILSARGFVTPQPHKRPKSSYRRFCADAPNERWQLDITHYRLADDTEVEILNILDDHSRLAIASTTRRIFTAGDVDAVFTAATSTYGDPAELLSDNGAVFTGAPRRGGRVALEVTCQLRGIRTTHSRPYHPQTCGKVERFHQTLKKWLDHQPRPATVRQLQALLDQFRDYYNTVRPHRALGRLAPQQAYTARPNRRAQVPTAAAAARIASIVTWGCDTIDTCEPATSVIVAPARSAIERCVPGGMTRSSVPTTAQLGRPDHAGLPDGVVFALNVIGRWLSTISQRSASGRSCANESCTVSALRNASTSPSGPPG
jgi:transposase InsO family protein